MAESKKDLMLERGALYLQMVREDPTRNAPEIKAMAEFVGVSRRLFYKADPDIQRLVAELEELREAAGAETSLVLEQEDDGVRNASDAELAGEIEQAVRRAVWAMEKFIGQRARTDAAAEASLVAYDLDVCIGQLRAVQQDLRPLVNEIESRNTRSPDQSVEQTLFGGQG